MNTQKQGEPIPDIIEIYRGENRCHIPNEKAVLWSLSKNDAFRDAAEQGSVKHAEVISALIHRDDIEQMPRGNSSRVVVRPGTAFDFQQDRLIDSVEMNELSYCRHYLGSDELNAQLWLLNALYRNVYGAQTEISELKEMIRRRRKAAAMPEESFNSRLLQAVAVLLFAVKVVAESCAAQDARQGDLTETEWRILWDRVLTNYFGEADGETPDEKAKEPLQNRRLVRTGYLQEILHDAEVLAELQRCCNGPEERRLQIESSRQLIADAVLSQGID